MVKVKNISMHDKSLATLRKKEKRNKIRNETRDIKTDVLQK